MKIAQGAQAIRSAKLRQDFYQALADDPRGFVNKWLESQSKDLDLVLGNEHGVREEDLKNTEYFRQPWVDDAVSIQEGLRVAGALQRMHEGR
jgi:SWI/SNF-related matrix-associated actin-dependent regulator of chromatin subfamily D